MTEEVTLVTVLSDQKHLGNSSEHRFKGTVWRMVEGAVRAIGEEPGKNSKQCKVRYQQVSYHLHVLRFH